MPKHKPVAQTREPRDSFAPLDASISDVQRMRGESRSTVLRKIEKGVCVSFLSGGKRKITLQSVFADREREIEADRKMRIAPNAP